MTYQAATAAELLGVKPKKSETTLTLAYSVEKGLPVSALDKFAGRVSPNDVRRFTYRVVPKPTLERRRKQKQLVEQRRKRPARARRQGVRLWHRRVP